MLYITTALLNYSLVQSLIGSAIGSHFSHEWGGTVKVGSVHIDPFNHVSLNNVLLVSPVRNDTVLSAGKIACRFNGLPIADGGIRMKGVLIKNTTFHLYSSDGDHNFRYIIDYFRERSHKKEKEKKEKDGPFVVDIKDVVLDNMRYKMTLKTIPYYANRAHGVDVANMDMDSINAHITNLRVVDDAIKCHIVRMSTVERSGWRMKKLAGDVDVSGKGINVTNMLLQTQSMNMVSDVHLLYDSWKSLDWYCDSVYMDVTFKNGNVLSMMDAAYWAPSLWGCDTPVKIEGHVTGPVANLRVEDFRIDFGRKSHIFLDGTVVGLPYVDGTFFDVHLHQLRTDIDDLLAINHPGTLNLGDTKLYEEIGTLDLTADLVGGASQCFLNLDVRTALGNVSGQLISASHAINKKRMSQGKLWLSSKRVDFPSIAKNDWVTYTGFDIEADARWSSLDDMKATLEAKLANTSLAGNNIDKATITAELNNRVCDLELDIKDSVLNMVATGNLAFPKGGDPRYSFDVDLPMADLGKLKLIDCDSTCTLSTHLQADLSGKGIPTGYAWVNNIRLVRDDRSLTLDNVNITASESVPGKGKKKESGITTKKKITLESDIANMTATGYFDYSDIPILVRKFESDYIPSYWQKKVKKPTDAELMEIVDADINVDLRWLDRTKQIHFFMPNLDVAQGTTITATYNYTEALKMVVRSDSVTLGGVALHGVGITSNSRGEHYHIAADISELALSGKGALDDLRLDLSSGVEGAGLALKWDKAPESIDTRGDVAFEMYSDSTDNVLNIIKPHFYLNGEQWTLSKKGDIRFNKARIEAEGVELANGDQSLIVGYHHTAGRTNDNIQAKFVDVDLSTLSDILLKETGFTASGSINGDGSVQWVADSKSPFIKANLMVDSCEVNDNLLGDMNLRINHDIEKRRMHLFVNTELREVFQVSHPLLASGYMDFRDDETLLNLTAGFERFDLASVSPLLKSFSSRFEGFLTGDITLGGTLKKPQIIGKAWVQNGLLNIDATNVAYLIDDTITFTNNRIRLNQFNIRDVQGNTGQITGNIDHNGFSDISTDLKLKTDRLMVYNSQGGSASGTVFAALNGTVRGPLSALDINASARTLNGSSLVIPISSQKNIKSTDYITFVSDDDYNRHDETQISKKKKNVSSTINLNLALTPDLELHIPMDMSGVGLDIDGSGNGELTVNIAPQKDLQVVGDYRIAGGNIKLDLLSVVSKEFKIEEGSMVEFPGSIGNASLDVNAIYSQRVELSSLLGSDENTIAQKPVPVESIVSLTGKLNSPEVKFDLRLPNADQSVQDEVFAYIDRSNERDMMNQTLYLLVRGKFYNANQSNATTTDETNLTSSGLAVVANSLGSVVSSMIEFVDIEFDYSAATASRSEQYSVGINKEWNKFYIESTLGYGGYDRGLSSSEALANNIVGDVLMGYKFNPRFHMFVFNRSNTNDYTRFEMPYKQGVGLKYTRDFDKWSDLFRKKGKKAEGRSKR